VAEELDLLVDTINRRKEKNFQTTQITTLISELENDGLMTKSEYLQTVNLFYDTFIEYLEEWAYPFESLRPFKRPDSIWRSVQDSPKSVAEVDKNILKIINEEELFDVVSYVKDK
jgi:hypothetical protein